MLQTPTRTASFTLERPGRIGLIADALQACAWTAASFADGARRDPETEPLENRAPTTVDVLHVDLTASVLFKSKTNIRLN